MKQIELTQGQVALVDDQDFYFLNKWKWYAHRIRNTFYAARGDYNYITHKNSNLIWMHREILQLSHVKIEVDHKDGNGLNNQRNNIRPATHRQNIANMKPFKNCTSKFKGVQWDSKLKKWRARIYKDGKLLHLGYFLDEHDAAIAYNKKAKEVFGEFAYINKVA